MKANYTTYKKDLLRSWIALLISLVIYAFIFFVSVERLGTRAFVLAFFPVMVGAWHLGIKSGILSTTVAFLIGGFLLGLKGDQQAWMVLFHDGLVGTLSLYTTAVIIGYLSYREKRYKAAVDVRVRIAENYETQAASLHTLVNITNEVLDATDLTSVLHSLAEQALQMFEAQGCLISLWDGHEQRYYPRAAAGGESAALTSVRSREESTILARLQRADVLLYGTLTELEEVGQPFLPIYPRGALLALPLVSGGEKIGILHLLYDHDHPFPPHQLAYAKLVSRQISQAIFKVILLANAGDQVEELSVLHEIAVVLSIASTETDLLEKSVEVLGASLYSENLTIVLLDQKKKVLVRSATFQVSEQDIFDLIPLGRGVTGMVAQSGELERYDDIRNAPHYIESLSSTLSEICVPIKAGQKVLGVINIESDQLAAFDARDERILTTVANQIAVALIRLRVEQAQVERVYEIDRSHQLIHALTAVAAEMEMSSQPNAVMKEMGAALEALGLKILIALFEPGSQDLIIRYTSLDSEIIQKLERFAGKTAMKDFRIAVDSLPSYISLTENLQPVLLHDYISVISRVLQGFTNDVLRRILDRTIDSSKMVLGHFPLVYREKVLGLLWLWGENLQEADVPTLSVFAKQFAATLENARLFADVQRLAITDGLTKLSTRRHFFELAYEEFYRARRYGRPLSVLMLDLDHFKNVNDTYGHAAGDIALEAAAAACKTTLRTNDLIGRYGGEEIVILLVETDLSAAHKVALRIWQKIRDLRIPTKKGDVRITISGGVAGDNVEEMNLIEMIEAADQAMYAAKKAGRDRIEIASKVPFKKDE